MMPTVKGVGFPFVHSLLKTD